jgi:Zn-dependent protease
MDFDYDVSHDCFTFLDNCKTMDPMMYILQGIIVVYSITVHEFAHAWMADRLWDPTPRLQGRLTINPISHVDIVGLVLLFTAGFGRGRPVIFNPHYLKNPLRDEFWIAMAWPLSNIILASLSLLISIGVWRYSVSSSSTDLITQFWSMSAMINIGMAVFNMIPLPPLDGFRLVKLLTGQTYLAIEQYGHYIMLAIFVLSSIPQFNLISKIITPVIMAIYHTLSWLVTSIYTMVAIVL